MVKDIVNFILRPYKVLFIYIINISSIRSIMDIEKIKKKKAIKFSRLPLIGWVFQLSVSERLLKEQVRAEQFRIKEMRKL